MDSRTAEIFDMEARDLLAEAIERNNKFEHEEVVALESVSFDEVAQGYANFNTWAEALGLNLSTRQLRRKAQKRYNKALKRRGK